MDIARLDNSHDRAGFCGAPARHAPDINSQSLINGHDSPYILVSHVTTVQTADFQKLPVELVIQLMKACPDLSTLLSLAYTSKRMMAVFTDNTASITKSIMDSSPLASTPIPSMMRAVLEIRTGTFDCEPAPEGLLHRRFRETHHYDEFQDMPPVNHPWKPELWRLCPPLVLRQLVHLADKIHILSHMAMDVCIQRFVADDPMARGWVSFHKSKNVQKSSEDMAVQAEKVANLPSPSWLAEQRMVLAFWRLQFFIELKEANQLGRLPSWSVEHRNKLARTTVENFFSTRARIREQVCTALAALEEAKAIGVLFDPKPIFEPPFRLPDLLPATLYSHDLDNFSSSLSCRFPAPIHPSFPGEVDGIPTGFAFVQQVSPSRFDCGICFQPFRKYGLFVWDRPMIRAMGLWPKEFKHGEKGWARWKPYFDKWKSLVLYQNQVDTEEEGNEFIRGQWNKLSKSAGRRLDDLYVPRQRRRRV